jgi:hypothetical protein
MSRGRGELVLAPRKRVCAWSRGRVGGGGGGWRCTIAERHRWGVNRRRRRWRVGCVAHVCVLQLRALVREARS